MAGDKDGGIIAATPSRIKKFNKTVNFAGSAAGTNPLMQAALHDDKHQLGSTPASFGEIGPHTPDSVASGSNSNTFFDNKAAMSGGNQVNVVQMTKQSLQTTPYKSKQSDFFDT